MADRRALRRVCLLALVAAVLLCVAGVFQHELWTPDEPREAQVGREMLESGFSAVPTLGGEPFLEKPPLYAWITAATYAAFGASASSARLPSTLFSIGAVLVAYALGRRAGGRVAGACSALALATMQQFSQTSHKAVLDTALTFFVAAGHLAFLRLRAERCVWNYAAIGALSGLAFLTKAWIGPALMCAPPILAWAAMGDWATVKRVLPRAFVAAVLGVALLGGPWVMAVANTPHGGWAAVKESLWTEYVGRGVGGDEFAKKGHANPPWYYLTTSLIVIAPWCLAIPALVKSRVLDRSWRDGRARWCALVFLAGVVLLSVPSGKRDLYLVPLLPAAAVALGAWLARAGTRRGSPWDLATCRGLAWLGWTVIVILGAGVTYASRGGRLPASIADGAADLDYRAFGWGAVAVGVPALAAAIWVRRGLRIVPPPPMKALWALALLVALFHTAATPFLDPHKDLRPDAEDLARLVPADEPMLGLSLDETTVALVPWFTGRLLANVDEAELAQERLDTGPARHLVLMRKDLTKKDFWTNALDLRKRLVLVGSTGEGDRTTGVYRYEKP